MEIRSIRNPEPLNQVLQPGGYMYKSVPTSESSSCCMALAIGLFDFYLRQNILSEDSRRVGDLVKNLFTQAIIEFYHINAPETRGLAEDLSEKFCNCYHLRMLRSQFHPHGSSVNCLVASFTDILSSAFPEEFDKILLRQPLTASEYGNILEGAASLWGLEILFFQGNSLLGHYGEGNSIGPIALGRDEGNLVFLLHDQETYQLTCPPVVNMVEAQRFRAAVTASNEAQIRLRSALEETEGNSIIYARYQPVSHERSPPLLCHICNKHAPNGLVKACPGHVVCNDCRIHAVAFGTMKCPAPGCREPYRVEESEALIKMTQQKYGVDPLPLARFTCQICQDSYPWANKIDCRCAICTMCGGPCSCASDSRSSPQCGLCSLTAIDPFITPCRHIFCHSCAWTLFYNSTQCHLCHGECSLFEIQPASASQLRANSSAKTNELIQSLASVLRNSDPNFTSLSSQLKAFLETKPELESSSVGTASRFVAMAAKVSSTQCSHRDQTILATCMKRHCLTCMFTAQDMSEEEQLPSVCMCGRKLDSECTERLIMIRQLLR